MPYSMSMEQLQKQSQSLKQMQRLIMSREMQQAIHFLQVPVMELGSLIELELEQNPVLETSQDNEGVEEEDIDIERLNDEVEEEMIDGEMPIDSEVNFDEHDFEILRRLDEEFRDYVLENANTGSSHTEDQDKLQTFLENSIVQEKTLSDYLLDQMREAILDEKERLLAETLIGSLDENGFLATPMQELVILLNCSIEELERVLHIIQTFHPAGIGAKDLRESLLIQLARKGKQDSLAYKIVDMHFEDLLKNHIPAIKTAFHKTAEAIREAIDKDIVPLDLHPGRELSSQNTSFITPDLTLEQEGDALLVTLNDQSLPPLRLNKKYLRMLNDETLPKETREFIQDKVGSAKWLLKNIMQRNDTLERIGKALAVYQKDYFLSANGNLSPLTMQTVADELELHESTVARAVSNKYIDTPRGLFPLRYFFTNALETDGGEVISSKTVREFLQNLIKGEDKAHPISDEVISSLMKQKGIHCARRTVAKYRIALGIGNAQQRRKF